MPDDVDLPPPPPPDIDIPLGSDFPHHLDLPPAQDLPRPAANNPHPKPDSSKKKKAPAWLPRALIGGALVLVIILLIVLAPKPQSASDLAREDDAAAEVANGEEAPANGSEDAADASESEANDGAAAEESNSDEAPADSEDRDVPADNGDDNEDASSADTADPTDDTSGDASPDASDATGESDSAATTELTPPPRTTAQGPTTTPLPGAPAAPDGEVSQPGGTGPTTTPLPQPAQPPAAAAGGSDAQQPAFQDQFEDNRNAWTTGRFNDMETSSIEDGVLRVAWDGRGSSYEVYGGQVFTNFVAEVECAVVEGGDDASCGIIVTANQSDGAYEFEVLNNLYRLGYYNQQGQALEVPISGDPTGIIKPNQTNQLRLKHEGGETSLYLNGQLLDSSSAIALPGGNIGLSTNSYNDQGAEVLLDNFTIWSLP